MTSSERYVMFDHPEATKAFINDSWRFLMLHFSRRVVTLFCVCIAVFTGAFASAGDFYEKDGVALNGYDPAAYFLVGKAVPGDQRISAEFRGSIFYFASEENRDKFNAAPESFVPQFGGYCAYGASRGYKAKIDPTAFSIVNGKLYLNYDAKVQSVWNKDVAGFISQAESKWAEVERQSQVFH